MTDLSIHTFLSKARAYLLQARPNNVPGWQPNGDFTISPLAQGEYNMNFLVKQGKNAWVLRINTGSGIGLTVQDQIAYEYKTLQLLEPAGSSPVPYFLDNSLQHLPYGILGMSYLPGEPLNYRRDLMDSARLFAKYHQLKVPAHQVHLIEEKNSLTKTFERCTKALDTYVTSDLADPNLSAYFEEVRAWADEARHHEKYYLADPWHCIVNTEVNNTNWIVNPPAKTIHLVDWERAQWGDPSQDLSHFRVSTTTLWKTDYRMTPQDQQVMMETYKAALRDPHLRDTIEERTRLRDPFSCLRAISWCAMSWVKYQQNEHVLKNPDTFQRFALYISLDFVRSVFDPYLRSSV